MLKNLFMRDFLFMDCEKETVGLKNSAILNVKIKLYVSGACL